MTCEVRPANSTKAELRNGHQSAVGLRCGGKVRTAQQYRRVEEERRLASCVTWSSKSGSDVSSHCANPSTRKNFDLTLSILTYINFDLTLSILNSLFLLCMRLRCYQQVHFSNRAFSCSDTFHKSFATQDIKGQLIISFILHDQSWDQLDTQFTRSKYLDEHQPLLYWKTRSRHPSLSASIKCVSQVIPQVWWPDDTWMGVGPPLLSCFVLLRKQCPL